MNSEAAVSTITASTQARRPEPARCPTLVPAKLNAAHTGAAASTRLECSLNSGGSQLDFIKIRLQANAGVEPVIFAAPSLQGFVTLRGPGLGDAGLHLDQRIGDRDLEPHLVGATGRRDQLTATDLRLERAVSASAGRAGGGLAGEVRLSAERSPASFEARYCVGDVGGKRRVGAPSVRGVEPRRSSVDAGPRRSGLRVQDNASLPRHRRRLPGARGIEAVLEHVPWVRGRPF